MVIGLGENAWFFFYGIGGRGKDYMLAKERDDIGTKDLHLSPFSKPTGELLVCRLWLGLTVL